MPDSLAATLTVQIELDPQDPDAFVRTDDWFRLTLPDGVALADASMPTDVVAVEEQGNATETCVGKASLADGQLKVEFASDAPESVLSEEALAYATQEQAAAALVKMPAASDGVLRAQVELQVTVDSALLSDQPSTIEWVLQQNDSGDQQVAQLALPARSELEQQWAAALESAQPAQPTDPAEAETPEAAVANVKQALSEAAVVMQSTTTYQVSMNAQVSSIIIWCDNNNGGRPSTDSLENGFIPYYREQGTDAYKPLLVKDDATGTYKVSQEAIDELHLNETQINQLSSLPLVDISKAATNAYEVLSHALPSSVATVVTSPTLDDHGNPTFNIHGDQIFNTTTTTKHYEWKLVDTNTYSGYVDGASSTWDRQYKMLTAKVEFTVIGKIGDQALPDVFGSEEERYFQLGASINSIPQEETISIAQAVEEGTLELQTSDDGKTCTITGMLPQYDEDGYPIVYHIKYTGPQNTDDYYQPDYDNSASASHGGATDALYVNGTMTLRHAGTTDYHATKQWLDSGDEGARPAVTFTLWRYSLNGGSAATASQVTLNADSTTPGAATNAASYVQVTLPAGSDDSVDLHALLKAAYGDAIDQLPKYDPDGYPYVYALREEPISGYEQVFGSVGADGSVDDTPPAYKLPDGTWASLDSDTRPDNDRFVYNAGVISNRVTGTTTTEMTKTWDIAAFQDSLQNVVCEFTAQCRVNGSDGEWQDVDDPNAVQSLTSWNAETLTKSITATFPKYDAHGKELEYRWVESAVTQDGEDLGFVSDGNGGGTFTIDMVDVEGNPETLEFTSTPVTTSASL